MVENKKVAKNLKPSGWKQKLFQEKLFSRGEKQKVVQNIKPSDWKQKVVEKFFV